MAKFQSLKLGEEYLLKLSRLEQNADSIIKQAVYQGAKVVGDAIKSGAESLPEERFRKLGPGELFSGVTPEEKEAIVEGFGLSDMERGAQGWNTKAGFAGYVTRQKTKKYPKGTPVPMLVRSIESGSSVRQKHPFVRTAVRSSRNKAVDAMEQTINKEIQKEMK